MDQEFKKPNEDLLDNLGPGCFVKVDQGNGPFWVEVDDIDGYIFGGKVHPKLSGIECPYHKEVNVLFNRSEISRLGCDRYCFC
jgi:hypothetical protein